MKNIKRSIIALITALVIAVGFVSPVTFAVDPGQQITNGVNAAGGSNNNKSLTGSLSTIVNVLLFILGAIAVIMVVVGGIRYVTSDGDPGKAKSARDTILYAIVGIVVALLAYAIVNFVIKSFK